MEVTTLKSHYTTFCMMLLGIIIGFLVGIQMGVIYWLVMLAISALILLSYWSTSVVLSVNIVDDHLVLHTTEYFAQETTRFNIKEIELQLFYSPATAKKAGFYSMHVIRNNKVLHKIRYDKSRLSAFILDFNQRKARVLH